MRFLDLAREGLAGVMGHRLRSLLSALGILFGVAAVIGILSIGEGARQEQQELIEHLGILNFQLKNRPAPEDEEQLAELRRKSRGLSRTDARALGVALPGAVHVGGMRVVEVRDIVPPPREDVRVVGAEPAWLAGTKLVRTAGRALDAGDEARRAQVALVGSTAARALFGGKSALGRRVRLGEVWVVVVGVFDDGSRSSSATIEGVDLDDRSRDIVLPLSTALGRFALDPNEPELTEIQVALHDANQVAAHTQLARRVIRRLHSDAMDFDTVVPLRLLEQTQAQQRVFNLVMGLIAGISLLVGGIGIMNIMLASVLERTREIGLRLAIGATPGSIRALFLAEASVISLTGGLMGVVAGYAISMAVAGLTGWATSVSWWAVVLAVLLSVVEGVVFGFLPAQRAAKLPPVTALRHA